MVNVYSLTELKNASDDTIPLTLEKLGYRQSHTLMDVRLALGYVGVIAAALAGAYDYKVGFEKAKGFTLIGVIVYFVCYGGMNIWQYFVEKGTVYAGSKGDSKVIIRTSTHSSSPVYKVSIIYQQAANKPERVLEKQELFTKWFDVDGNIVAEPLTTWMGILVQEAEGKDAKKKR